MIKKNQNLNSGINNITFVLYESLDITPSLNLSTSPGLNNELNLLINVNKFRFIKGEDWSRINQILKKFTI